MKKALLLAAFSAVILSAAVPAKADSTSSKDPRMIPLPGSAGGCGSTAVTLVPFNFTVNSSGDSTTANGCFENTSGVAFGSLTVTTTNPPAAPGGVSPCKSTDYMFSEQDALFENVACNFDSSTGLLTVTFSGVVTAPGVLDFPGIPTGTDFFMDMAGWNANESFTGTANANMPEPGSLALLGLGLGTIFVFGRRKFVPKTI